MQHAPGRGWHFARDYATQAAVGGAFLVLTGFAPEEWLAHVVRAVHLPDSTLHLWTAGIDLRFAVVVVGMTIIVGDLIWRRHAAHASVTHATSDAPTIVHRVGEPAATGVTTASPIATAPDDVSAAPPLPISYCRTPDGVRLAYAKFGTGPVLVRAGHWFSHLQLEWEDPGRRAAMLRLGKGRTLVCWDARGCGLSDWDVPDLSLDAWVLDMETVIAAAQVDRFAVFGASQTTSVAISYAAHHPERVTKLILYGGYARGWKFMPEPERQRRGAMQTLARLGWGQENPAFRAMFAAQFMPDASKESFDAFNEFGRKCVSPENVARYLDAVGDTNVTDLLGKIRAPTLVGHVRGDERTPFEGGRELAAGIPGAHFVPLPGRNHALLPGDPAREIWMQEIERFLSEPDAA